MKVYNLLSDIPSKKTATAFSLGCFDGVHKGHQYILGALVAKAKEIRGQSCVLTFSNHPSWILKNSQNKNLLSSSLHKLELLKKLGIDIVLELPFTKEFSELSPERFFESLNPYLNIKACVFGADTCIGKNRIGTQNIIRSIGKRYHFEITALERISDFSSTQIRSYLTKGKLDKVEEYLQRPFSIMQSPIPGKGIGKSIGFPTINFSVENLALPPRGVYISQCIINGSTLPAISNLGVRPTFGHSDTAFLETHILKPDFSSSPEVMEVQLLRNLREEKKFENRDSLKAQIAKDIEKAKVYFSGLC